MVLFKIDVQIREKGSAEIKSGLKNLQKTADRTRKIVSGIGKRIKTDKVRRFNRELRKTGDIGKQVRGIITQIFGAIGVGLAIREVVRMSDVYQNFQNRLKIVTEGTENLTNVTRKLFETANETRVSFSATAELFTRVAIATKNLGKTQQEVINFTRTLNKAVRLPGATAADARNGIIQLSQGLASGALRGDELRSVLEQLPKVADAISTSMGITRGELRKMGEAGLISADIIINAMAKAAKQIDLDFSTTIPTISQAFTVLSNQVTQMVGEFNKMTGAAGGLSGAIIDLSNHLPGTIAGLTAMGLALGGLAIGAAAMTALGGAAIATLIAMAPAAIVLGVAVDNLSEKLKKYNEDLAAIAAASDIAFDSSATLGGAVLLAKELKSLEADMVTVNRVFEEGGKTSRLVGDRLKFLELRHEVLTDRIDASSAAYKANTKEGKANAKAQKLLAETFAESITAAALFTRERRLHIAVEKELKKVLKEAGEGADEGLIRRQIKTSQETTRLVREKTAALEGIKGPQMEINRMTGIFIALEKEGKISTEEMTLAIEKLNASRLKELIPPGFNEGLENAVQHIKKLGVDAAAAGEKGAAALEGKMVASLLKGVEAAQTFTEKIQRINEIVERIPSTAAAAKKAIDKLLGPSESEEFFAQLDLLNAKLKEGRISAFQYREEVRKIGPTGQKAATEFGDGFTAAFNRFRDEANDLKKVVEEIVDLFANKAVEAIHTLATEGSLNFKAFAADVLKQIAKIIIRLLIVKALSTLGDAFTGGAGSTIAGAGSAAIEASQQPERRAHGGDVEEGRPYLVGENGPEVVVPNQSGTVIANGALQAPPPPPEVNVTVVNAIDPDEIQTALASGDLDSTVINIIARNGDQARTALQQS